MDFGKKKKPQRFIPFINMFTYKRRTLLSPSITANGKFSLKSLKCTHSPSSLKKSQIHIYNTYKKLILFIYSIWGLDHTGV